MAFWTTLHQGEKYLKSWVLKPQLNAVFTENLVIRATIFAKSFMPFLAVFALCWVYFFGRDLTSWGIGAMTAVFALLIPMQGLYWLGKRANSPLPARFQQWYERICQQLQQANVAVMKVEKPKYQDLANLLQQAQHKLDDSFWQEV